MAHNESQTNETNASTTSLIPPEFAELGKKRLDELVAIQSEQVEKLQEVNRHWMERMQSEAALASEFTAKLTAARSMPDVATAYQEWASRHMEMAAEDAKRMFTDGQKLAEAGTRLLSNGWLTNGKGSGGST